MPDHDTKHVFKTTEGLTEGLYFTATLIGDNTWKSDIITLPTGVTIDPITFNYTANQEGVELGDKRLGKIEKDSLRGLWHSSSGGTRRRNAKRVKKSRSHRRNRKSKSKK